MRRNVDLHPATRIEKQRAIIPENCPTYYLYYIVLYVGHLRRRSRDRMGGSLQSTFRCRSLVNSRGCQPREVTEIDTRHHQIQREDRPSAFREPTVLQSGSVWVAGSVADRRTQSVRLYLRSITGVLPYGGGCAAGDAYHYWLAQRRGTLLSWRLHGEWIRHQPGTSP